MPFVPNQPFPVVVAAAEAQQTNKNKGIGGRILDFVLGAGTGSSIGPVETIVETDKKSDNTIYYVIGGVVVILAGIYFFTHKKK